MTTKMTHIDWDRIDETWYVAGFGCVYLDEAMLHAGGNPDWSEDDMDQLFLNRKKIQKAHSFPIKWEAFDQKHGGIIFRLGRNELLQAIVAFSKDENSIKETYSYYSELQERRGVQLSDYGDQFSSILPDFYYDPAISAEDLFFDFFLPKGLAYSVYDPVKFAAWVLKDHRWQVLVTVKSL